MDLARARKLDLIVIWRIDRALRSVLDGAATLERLRACGIRSVLRNPLRLMECTAYASR